MKIKTTIKVEIIIDESQPECCDVACRFFTPNSYERIHDCCCLFDKVLNAKQNGALLRCDDCVKELKKEF